MLVDGVEGKSYFNEMSTNIHLIFNFGRFFQTVYVKTGTTEKIMELTVHQIKHSATHALGYSKKKLRKLFYIFSHLLRISVTKTHKTKLQYVTNQFIFYLAMHVGQDLSNKSLILIL